MTPARRASRIAGGLVGVAAALASGMSLACISPPRTPMRDQLEVATTIVIFQLESSELSVEKLGPQVEMPLLRGRLRMVEQLRGPPARFARYELSAACNDLRMDVGDYFLLATTQKGGVLELGRADATVMFAASAYSRGVGGLPYGSADVEAVMEFLKGKPLPPAFGLRAKPMTQKFHLPPPCAPRQGR